jgi:hypothetical protein
MLRRFSQFAAVVLVVAVVAMPLMACMVPDREMTAEEHECCKKMAQDCESSAMPASHSCCQHPVARHVVNVSRIRSGDFAISAVALVQADLAPLVERAPHLPSTFESPPESPPKLSTVLRI